jgi:hypothetical protein
MKVRFDVALCAQLFDDYSDGLGENCIDQRENATKNRIDTLVSRASDLPTNGVFRDQAQLRTADLGLQLSITGEQAASLAIIITLFLTRSEPDNGLSRLPQAFGGAADFTCVGKLRRTIPSSQILSA